MHPLHLSIEQINVVLEGLVFPLLNGKQVTQNFPPLFTADKVVGKLVTKLIERVD